MEEFSRYQKVKRHLKDNKKVYFVGAGCLAVGASIGGAVVFRRFGGFPLEISQTAKNQALINWKPEITQIALVKKCCPDPIPVLDKLTGKPHESIRGAAKATGETIHAIRKDVHGLAERFEELPKSVFA
jgi:hypothetical protein